MGNLVFRFQKGWNLHPVLVVFLFLTASLWSQIGIAAKEDLQKYLFKRVDALYNDKSTLEAYFSKFEDSLSKKSEPSVLVNVEKEKVDVEDEGYTLGRSHLRVFINAPVDHIKNVLSNSSDFQKLYRLDKSAIVKSKLGLGESFRAHIFKSLPIVSNQDYIMSYKEKMDGDRWLQRSSLHKDNEDFALREVVQVVEPFNNGSIYREVAVIYILRWYLRALGAQVRSITKTEMTNIGRAVKCYSENTFRLKGQNLNDKLKSQIADKCWENAEGFKENPTT